MQAFHMPRSRGGRGRRSSEKEKAGACGNTTRSLMLHALEQPLVLVSSSRLVTMKARAIGKESRL